MDKNNEAGHANMLFSCSSRPNAKSIIHMLDS